MHSQLWTVGHQASLSMGSSSKNTGVGCHALLQGIFLIRDQTMSPTPSALTGEFFTTSTNWKALHPCEKRENQIIFHMAKFLPDPWLRMGLSYGNRFYLVTLILFCSSSLTNELLDDALRLSRVWLFVTAWTVACQAPLSMGFPRHEYWSGLPCPPPIFYS